MVVYTTLLFAFFALPVVWAQFPAVCNTEDSLSTKTCCPDNCGSHGTCVSIREEVERSWESANATIVKILGDTPGWPQDVRYQWPLKIFESVCSCANGWGGYDCSRCDFGFIANEADECVKRNTSQLLVRRNFVDLSKQEQLNFFTLLETAKNEEEKDWASINSVPDETNDYYNLQNVSAYDMMVSTHMLSVKEKQNPNCPPVLIPNASSDEPPMVIFAHKDTPFLPWHRYFVMLFESHLQQIAERMGINDFALPYWDWTPTSNRLMFTQELFGTPGYDNELVNVSGTLFENGKWPVVCDEIYRTKSGHVNVSHSVAKCIDERTLCDVEGDRMVNRQLQRGTWRESIISLADYKLIAMSLIPDKFEGPFGFSHRLEGGTQQCSGETVKCMYEPGDTFNLHNIAHEYLGGHMSIGGPSPNDPIFFIHHANTDRIYERWLQKYNGTLPSYHPINGGPPGHNLNDYMVPLFPVSKIGDWYKESKEFGYVYDELPWDIPTTDYQEGCPSEQCDKGGYPPTVLVNTTSTYSAKI